MHDFVVVYRRSDAFRRNLLPRTAEQDRAYKNPDNDHRGPWKPADYTCNKTKGERPNLYYALANPHTGHEVWPDEKRVWAYSEDVAEIHVAENRLWWGKDGTNAVPALKNFLSDVQRGLVPTTWWPQEDVGHTDEAKKEVQRILGNIASTMTPKPVDLLRRVIRIAAQPGDIILDSFAGTGTTGEAALRINAEDKGNRTFILVQMRHDSKEDEKQGLNICERLTATRIRRVITGYEYLSSRKDRRTVAGLGGSFTYARVGDRLFGEYRDLGKKLPSFEELAKYIFYTETSRECDLKKIDPVSGFIGATDASGGTSYYLLYTPDRKADREMSLVTLREIAARDKNRNWVIYCEKIWLHQDQLRKFEQEHGKHIRPMVVPFQLK